MLAGMATESCTNRPNTHWKRRSEWQRGIIPKSYGFSSLLVTRLQCGKGLKDITNYKTPSTVENQQLADDLNEFYCRFEKTPFTPPATPVSPTPAIQFSEDDVRQVFRKNKRRKAPGPDDVTPACLKSCADQLAPIFTQIFNRSLELCEVPSCFKHSTIIPVPKKPKITGFNPLGSEVILGPLRCFDMS